MVPAVLAAEAETPAATPVALAMAAGKGVACRCVARGPFARCAAARVAPH